MSITVYSWPGKTCVSARSRWRSRWKESCITAAEASKSAPQPPQKSVSPVKATGVMLGSALEATSKMVEPSVWPGTWCARTVKRPTFHSSRSATRRVTLVRGRLRLRRS